MVSQPWQSVVQKKQDEASAKIPTSWRLPSQYTQSVSENARNNVLDVPRQCGLLSPRQLEITENYDATALLEMIHAGTLTSYEVTEAFCLRAAIAQQVVCCYSPITRGYSRLTRDRPGA
jgi:amidase